ncbi:cytochrome P450 [Streptomyces hokutonensis]|uniref:cytochrome P450 n=1 Tax=Streptomyces hokutonensis TaxID=1306990 RepID=UPI0003629619|nr:cytochrome P450 [Streptomyces hokutonensis]
MTTAEHPAPSYPFGPSEGLDLHPRYAELRREDPVSRVTMPYGGEAWLVTRYDDIKVVLADSRFSRAATVGQDVPRMRPPIESENILSMDPPDHSRLRKLVSKAFTVRRIEELRPRVQIMVDELVDDLLDAGQPADLAKTVAWPLPVRVISELLGVPKEDRDNFRTWTGLALATGNETTPEQIEEALNQLLGYMGGLIVQRREKPTDDLLSGLIQARDDGDKLSEQELIVLAVTLLAAGHETTANQIGSHVYQLLTREGYWQRLVDDPELVPGAVEELLRHTPLSVGADNARVALEDVEVGGRLIRKGEAVVVMPLLGNRDASVFERPDELDLDREKNPHMAFGHGVHHCLGAPLARVELQLALGTLARRLPNLRLAEAPADVPWRRDKIVRGPSALLVTW